MHTILLDELVNDPENLGYRTFLESGSHSSVANMMNEKNIIGETFIPLDKLEDYMLTNGTILLIEETASTTGPAQNAARLILRLLSSRLTGIKTSDPAVQNVLNVLVAENVITEQNIEEINSLVPPTKLSRAEVLFGENFYIKHEDIGNVMKGISL
jgi:hypothetical protein